MTLCRPRTLLTWLLSGMLAAGASPVMANETDQAVAACLKAWVTHPFGDRPSYRVLGTSVKVFGIGSSSADTEKTTSPALVVVNPGVNVMGGSVIELLNPNGWYCLRSTVSVMGGMTIRLACGAQLASLSGTATVMGNNADQKGVTVMGSTTVERVGCPDGSRI